MPADASHVRNIRPISKSLPRFVRLGFRLCSVHHQHSQHKIRVTGRQKSLPLASAITQPRCLGVLSHLFTFGDGFQQTSRPPPDDCSTASRRQLSMPRASVLAPYTEVVISAGAYHRTSGTTSELRGIPAAGQKSENNSCRHPSHAFRQASWACFTLSRHNVLTSPSAYATTLQ
jgi:hypothetical protein